MTTVRIATRGSMLALWQANWTKSELERREPGLVVELVVLKTRGDKILDRALAEVGGKGLFVKEIEDALLDGRADVAVHSMKDLPAELAPGLEVAAIPEREDARDALVVRPGLSARSIAELPRGAKIGTSSLRRSCQLRALRPDLVIEQLRGNVDTRLGRVERGDFDAIILACAGLRRLGHGDRISAALSLEESLPAVGQGALAIECRAGDAATKERLSPLQHGVSATAVTAERAALARLQGGCQTPLGAHATVDRDTITIQAFVAATDGSQMLKATMRGNDATALGTAIADDLLSRGAAKLLGH